jgi:hypothetical protein
MWVRLPEVLRCPKYWSSFDDGWRYILSYFTWKDVMIRNSTSRDQ